MPYPATLNPASPTFGALLKALRKQAGMTQRDLAAALGYSDSQISGLEKDQRPPDLAAVLHRFVPALGLQDDPAAIARLVDRAAAARGERPPALLTFQPATQVGIQAVRDEPAKPLPLPPTELLGRSTAVNQLCHRLLGHNGRLLTLVGPPGIGKTRLALAVAAHLQHHYPQGAVVAPLATISDPTLVAVTIATAVGCSDASPKPPKTKLIEFLRRKTMLLVLDNCEQIIDAASLIAELVAECPGLCILATSRERLHLRAEQRFKVPPLDLAPAVELFVQRAQAVNAHFLCTPQNQATLEAICHRLDCLPLAIELCAGQIDLLAPTQLLTQLQTHRLDLLVDGAHDLPPRQRTLRTAIDASYSLLSESERLLLRTLGVFVGGFALTEVAAVAVERLEPASVQSTLHALIGKSLVRVEPLPSGEQRFLLLETIREFALEQARTHDEEALLRQRHADTYLQLFRTGDSYLRGAQAAVWFARLLPEQDNLRTALQRAFDEARYTDAAWLLIACEWFDHQRGQWEEKGRWLAQLLPHRHLLTVDHQLAMLISVHAFGRAVPAFQPLNRWKAEMLHVIERSTHPMRANAWHFIACHAANFAEAAAAWERSIALAHLAHAESANDPRFCLFSDAEFALGMPLWAYAMNLIEQGEFARALPMLLESRAIFERRESRYEMADSSGTLGLLAFMQGDLAKAHTYLQEAVSIASDFNYQEMVGLWQPLLALVSLYAGQLSEAHRLLDASLRLCLELKDNYFLKCVFAYQAEVALWEEKVDQAEAVLARSLAYETETRRINVYELQRLWVAARLATAQQQYARAATLFGLADQAHSQIHNAIGGPMRTLAADALATVREALDPTVFAAAFAAGQQLSLEEAFATLLAPPGKMPNLSPPPTMQIDGDVL
ncbi:MAG: helix-turn-helix domain-containing protein [Caldilineaceae bacterium]